MTIKALRQQNINAEVHWPSPKLGQQLALHSYVLDVFGVFGWFDGWNFLIKQDVGGRGLVRINRDLFGFAEEIASSPVATEDPTGSTGLPGGRLPPRALDQCSQCLSCIQGSCVQWQPHPQSPEQGQSLISLFNGSPHPVLPVLPFRQCQRDRRPS